MGDHCPIVGLQGTCLRFFDDFLTDDNRYNGFSGDFKEQILNGKMWYPYHDALMTFEKLFRDYSWLILLHGSISIPRYVVEYMRDYNDNQVDFASLYIDLIEELNKKGLLDIIELDDLLKAESRSILFRESSEALYDIVTKNTDYFFPKEISLRRIYEISDIGDHILSERISIAAGRPSLYIGGYQKILSQVGAYERMKDLSCTLSNFLLPNIPIIEDFLDVARVGGPIHDSIKANIDRLCEIKASHAGKTFRTIASQILGGVPNTPEVEKVNLECLRDVLKSQKTIDKIKKITFYVIAVSGAIGVLEPITGGI